MSSKLTLGAEEELHLIDLESWRLVPRAPQILARLPPRNYSAGIQRSAVEDRRRRPLPGRLPDPRHPGLLSPGHFAAGVDICGMSDLHTRRTLIARLRDFLVGHV